MFLRQYRNYPFEVGVGWEAWVFWRKQVVRRISRWCPGFPGLGYLINQQGRHYHEGAAQSEFQPRVSRDFPAGRYRDCSGWAWPNHDCWALEGLPRLSGAGQVERTRGASASWLQALVPGPQGNRLSGPTTARNRIPPSWIDPGSICVHILQIKTHPGWHPGFRGPSHMELELWLWNCQLISQWVWCEAAGLTHSTARENEYTATSQALGWRQPVELKGTTPCPAPLLCPGLALANSWADLFSLACC